MAPRAGLFLQDHRLTFVALTGRGRAERFAITAEENPGAVLKAELDARGLRCRRVRLGVERSLVTVKVLELPPVVGGDRKEMLRFELERHVPFPPEDAVFDAMDLPTTTDGPLRVLVVAGERRVVDRALRLLEEPRLKPAAVTVACHDLPRLLVRGVKARRAVWAHQSGATMHLLFLSGGQLRWSRSLPAGELETLADEIGSSLPLLKWKDCDAIWLSGEQLAERLGSTELAALGAPVSEPPWDPAMARLVGELPPDEIGPGVLALAVAAGRRRPVLNLLPEGLRPRTMSVAQIVTVGMLVVTAGLGIADLAFQGHKDRRYLKALDAATRTLEPQVKEAERVAAQLGHTKRLLTAIKSAEEGGLRPLPLLRELTEILPADAWLNSVNLDLKSVELNGQANTASQLIPLLESSSWLERAEFTSPVTKGRDKEQFRIRATWEQGPGGPPAKATPAADRPGAAATADRPAPDRGAVPPAPVPPPSRSRPQPGPPAARPGS
jgi:Tfp pilus assembly protein PilN